MEFNNPVINMQIGISNFLKTVPPLLLSVNCLLGSIELFLSSVSVYAQTNSDFCNMLNMSHYCAFNKDAFYENESLDKCAKMLPVNNILQNCFIYFPEFLT